MRLCSVSLIWLAVAAVRGVEGATDCKPATGTLTITTAQDVTDVKKCATFTGNIAIAANGPEDINLDGITSISGNVDISNVLKFRSLSSATLASVTSLSLNSLPQMTNLTLPALTKFNTLKWSNLPLLGKCVIATKTVAGEIQTVSITNTSLQSLDWLKWPVGAELNITSNPKLTAFTIPYSKINVGSVVTLESNAALKTVDVSALSGIYGSFRIASNNVDVLDFKKLETIGGSVRLNGGLKNITTPALVIISGMLTIESSEDISAVCGGFAGKSQFRGHYECDSKVQKNVLNQPGSSITTTTGNSPPKPTDSPQGNEEHDHDEGTDHLRKWIGIGAGVVIGLVLIIIVIIGFFIRQRRRQRAQILKEVEQQQKNRSSSSSSASSLVSAKTRGSKSFGAGFAKSELEAPPPPTVTIELAGHQEPGELDAGFVWELDAGHGASELQVGYGGGGDRGVAGRWGAARDLNSPAPSFTSVSSIGSATPLVRYEMAA